MLPWLPLDEEGRYTVLLALIEIHREVILQVTFPTDVTNNIDTHEGSQHVPTYNVRSALLEALVALSIDVS
jgi:hypothetical protein